MNERAETSFPPNGDGTYLTITPCVVCGGTRLILDDGPFCADCEGGDE